MEQYKTCSLCNLRKPLNAFHHDSNKSDFLTARCAYCRNLLQRAYVQEKRQGSWKSKKKPKLTADQIRAKRRAYSRKINSILVFKNATARARSFGAFIGIFSKREIKRLYAGICFYCGSDYRISIDHVIPLARGGNHSLGNLVSCCTPCNSSKKNKTIMEWKMSELRG